MTDWIELVFAGGDLYKVNVKEVTLPRITGTPLYETLNRAHLYNQEFKQPFFIPRYVYAFEAFMHCVREYDVNLPYLQGMFRDGSGPNMRSFIQVLRQDNKEYGIDKMDEDLDDIYYLHFPDLLNEERWEGSYRRQSTQYQTQQSDLFIRVDNYIDEHDACDDDPPHIYTPISLLERMYERLQHSAELDDFTDDMNARLPYIIIGLVEAISTAIEKPLAENYKENIKMRIRNDPGLIREIHENLKKANVLHIIQMGLSCLTLFALE